MAGLPGTLPLRLYRGDSSSFTVRVWTDAAHTIPADLTGASPAAELRQGAALATFDCTLTEPNIVDVALAADAWGDVIAGPARWDLELTWPDGQVNTILAGSVTITGDVTV